MTRRRSTSAALVLMTLWGTAGCTLVSSWSQNASAPSATSTSLPLRPASRPLAQASAPGQKTTVAVISDFGQCDDGEQQVADMVRSWDPALIFSAGDNSQGVEGCVPFIETSWAGGTSSQLATSMSTSSTATHLPTTCHSSSTSFGPLWGKPLRTRGTSSSFTTRLSPLGHMILGWTCAPRQGGTSRSGALTW